MVFWKCQEVYSSDTSHTSAYLNKTESHIFIQQSKSSVLILAVTDINMVTLPVWFCLVDLPLFYCLHNWKKNSSYTVSLGSIANYHVDGLNHISVLLHVFKICFQ